MVELPGLLRMCVWVRRVKFSGVGCWGAMLFCALGLCLQGKSEGTVTYGREAALQETWVGYMRSKKNLY